MTRVGTLRARGLTVELEGSTVAVGPVAALTDELRGWIRQHRAAIVADLLPEPVRWRVERLRSVLPAAGPIREPLEVVDGPIPADRGRCQTCGQWIGDPAERLPCGFAVRCGACRDALRIALDLRREGRPA